MKKNIFFFVVLSLSLISSNHLKATDPKQKFLLFVENYLQLEFNPDKKSEKQTIKPEIIETLKLYKDSFFEICKERKESLNEILLIACENGFFYVAKEAIKSGADPVKAQNEYHQTALQLAAQKGDISVLKLILKKGGDLHCLNTKMQTAIEIAMSEENEDAIEFIKNKMLQKTCHGHCKTCIQILKKLSFII